MKKIFFLFLLILVASCGYRQRDDKTYLPGNYHYELSTGLFQKLKINEDYTFKQIVYTEKNGTILYENNGKIYVEKMNIRFENWLECYENDGDLNIPISEPYNTTVIGSYWIKYKDSDEISIVLFDQTKYIFKKEL